ncbi:hypothetical protein TruAng_009805 [Truncatella angustata]|nr:hypothetical protein TruAng_009805 [Truncatella angustata]
MSRHVSERVREREVLKYATVFTLHSQGPSNRRATLSSADASLSAFAQLGALRLDAARCLISVFDETRQFVIAEGTPSSSLNPNATATDDYWLGCTALPRSGRVCEHMLTDDGDPSLGELDPSTSGLLGPATLPVTVIPDLAQDERYKDKPDVTDRPHNSFYAGVPLRTPRGINIGTLGIFDDKPRDGLDSSQVEFLQHMSCAVMSHLELRRSAENSSRSERMVRGIGSFVEGKSTISNLWRGTHAAAFEKGDAEGKLNANQQTLQQSHVDRDLALDESARESSRAVFTTESTPLHGNHETDPEPLFEQERESSPSPPPVPPSEEPVAASLQDNSQSVTDKGTTLTKFTLTSTGSVASAATKSFADEIHTTEIREAFGKAANIIRESIEVEGVAFLDAMVNTFGGLVSRGADSESASSDSHPDTSGGEGGATEEEKEPKFCRIFAFSTTDASSIDGKSNRTQINVPQKFLRSLLRRYPAGKTFRFDSNNEIVSGDSEEDQYQVPGAGGAEAQASLQVRKRNVAQSRQSEGNVLSSILQGARSVMMVPLWDPIQERWHAGAFVVSSPAREVPSGTLKRGSLKKQMPRLVCTQSRMLKPDLVVEQNRGSSLHNGERKATQSEKMKSDLLGSLSHELRSPLHGVLAGIELIQDTELDAFQGDALNSMESCGRTLLDVIEHLLDFSKMNSGRSREQQESFESKMLPIMADVDLGVLVEEVVESVYAGFGYERLRIGQPDQHGPTPGSMYNQDPYAYQDGRDAARFSTGGVTIYIDIDAKETWTRHIQPGGLRRIIMNILGNSMKYTNQGYIHIKMRQVKVPLKRNRHRTNLVLTITDSGKGITADFLRHKLFTPFSQEDSLQPGTGLGLSLIHQIVTLLNGSITVESQLELGTSFQVTLPLPATKFDGGQPSNLGPNADFLRGLRVSLRGFKEKRDTAGLPNHQAPIERQILTDMCHTWLGLEIVTEDDEDTRPDCIICSDQALEGLASEPSGLLPPVIVVCQNGSIAQKLLQNRRTGESGHFFECISQPIGPHKLSKALILAMERWGKFTTSLEPSADATVTSMPDAYIPPQRSDAEHSEVKAPPSSAPPLHFSLAQMSLNEEHVGSGTTQSIDTQMPNTSTHELHQSYESEQAPTSFLIVDDNKINLQILVAFMKKMKRSYKSAQDGLEALGTYAETPGHFRCILMDISMPVMDGLEATRRIREFEQARDLPRSTIIALTGMASASTQQEAFGSGVDFFLAKPVRLKQLTEILAEKGMSSPSRSEATV